MFEETVITPRKGTNGRLLSFEELLEMELRNNNENVVPNEGNISVMTEVSDCEDLIAKDRNTYKQQWRSKQKEILDAMEKFQKLECANEMEEENRNAAGEVDAPSYLFHEVSDTIDEVEINENIKDFECSLVEDSIIFNQPDPPKKATSPVLKVASKPAEEEKKNANKINNESFPTSRGNNLEMIKYQQMNAQLMVLRQEHEKAIQKFEAERNAFKEYKAKEMEKVNRILNDERRKLGLEMKQMQKQQVINNILPNKSERAEMENLRRKISELEESLRSKDLKHKLATDRLKHRITELTKRNDELQSEVCLLQTEKAKLQANVDKRKNDMPCPLKPPRAVKHASVERPKKQTFSASVSSHASKAASVYSQQVFPDGKVEYLYSDGTRVTKFANGSVRETKIDGTVETLYENGDKKIKYHDGSIEYYFADTGIKQTKQEDGTMVLEFPDGQIERQKADGEKEIFYPDGTRKFIYSTGEEECIFPDGTISRTDTDQKKVIEFPNGAREVYWLDMKQRFETDGTIRTVYPDGTRETKYPDGRIKRMNVAGEVSLY